MKLFIAITGLLLGQVLHAQQTDANEYIRIGNEYYKLQKYEQAVAEYAKAIAADPDNTTAKFNRANALYKANQQVEATKNFSELSTVVKEKDLRSKTYYNKGVILSNQKNLEESIEAYKNALRQNPDDKEARENLQKALLELKKKTPPDKNQDKKQNKNQNQQKQPQSKLNQKEAQQRLQLLAQKEKEVQERLQKEKSKSGGGSGKDW